MIKKNEIKMKASNKRLFSDISSSHSLNLSNNTLTSSPIITSVTNNNSKPNSNGLAKPCEDETDGQAKKFARIHSFNSFNRPLITTFSNKPNTQTINANQPSSFLTRVVASTASPIKESKHLTRLLNSLDKTTATNHNDLKVQLGNNFAKRLYALKNEKK